MIIEVWPPGNTFLTAGNVVVFRTIVNIRFELPNVSLFLILFSPERMGFANIIRIFLKTNPIFSKDYPTKEKDEKL